MLCNSSFVIRHSSSDRIGSDGVVWCLVCLLVCLSVWGCGSDVCLCWVGLESLEAMREITREKNSKDGAQITGEGISSGKSRVGRNAELSASQYLNRAWLESWGGW